MLSTSKCTNTQEENTVPSLNKITIIGHVGKMPELKYTPAGMAVCTFSVATSEKVKGEEHTTWFKCNVWGKSAENANQYVAKGRLIYIEGRLRMSEYTNREGVQRTTLEVNVSDWHLLDKRDTADAQPPQAKAVSAGAVDDLDDDIPF